MAAIQDELFRHPQVQASLRTAGEQALNDPKVQNALVKAAQDLCGILAVSAWAQDPEVQQRAKHYATEAARAAGQAMARAGQIFADQIAQGPAGLRLLAFSAGGLSLAACFMEMLHVESVLMGPSRYIISGFLGIFALTTMLFEMPADWVAMVPGITHYQDLIMDEAHFMTRAGGRGLFYLYQGAMWACFASLLSVVHLAAAAAMLLVGTLHVLMQFGIMPQTVAQKLRELDVRPETPQAARVREHHRHRAPFANDFEEVEEEEPPYINHTPDHSLNAAQSLGPVPNSSLPADGFRDDPFLTGRKLPEAGFERSAPALAPPMSSRLEGEDREGDPAPPQSTLPSKWEWPPWCLNFKSPNIEVWVLDEDAGIGRWVSAQPQSRVVDKSGRDAYLCAEYLWDGEYYVQDFGPQHVRRKGETPTVLQTLTQSEDPELEATKVFKKNGGSEALMETKVFKDKKKSKQEGCRGLWHLLMPQCY
eukprot:symbB.v1.2.034898.t1/scaffold4585.1/size37669/1